MTQANQWREITYMSNWSKSQVTRHIKGLKRDGIFQVRKQGDKFFKSPYTN